MVNQGPLKGVKVVDLTAMVMGPYCTQIMADMGADVVKIEPPAGDNTRYISVAPEEGMAGVFVNVNRGKRSVVLDLKQDRDIQVLKSLIKEADVFIHSMRSKAMAKLGLSYNDVSAINPNIIYTNCYGYSRRGPEADSAAYDDTIQGECGLPYVQQLLNGEPQFVGTIMADKIAGMTALYSTLMALFHRERSGEGQEVEVGMFEAMASFMLVEHANGALFTPQLSAANYPRAVTPNRKPYKTKDGYIAALVYNDKQWNAFCQAVDPEWARSDQFSSLKKRALIIDKVYGLLAQTFLTKTTKEWIDLLKNIEVPCAPIRTLDDLYSNEHLQAIDFFEKVATPYGDVNFPGIPTWFSKSPGKIVSGAPRLGEHTREVISQLNLDF